MTLTHTLRYVVITEAPQHIIFELLSLLAIVEQVIGQLISTETIWAGHCTAVAL